MQGGGMCVETPRWRGILVLLRSFWQTRVCIATVQPYFADLSWDGSCWDLCQTQTCLGLFEGRMKGLKSDGNRSSQLCKCYSVPLLPDPSFPTFRYNEVSYGSINENFLAPDLAMQKSSSYSRKRPYNRANHYYFLAASDCFSTLSLFNPSLRWQFSCAFWSIWTSNNERSNCP